MIRRDTLQTLKFWNERYPSIIFDGKFLKMLVVDVFGIECLAASSVFGGRVWNSQSQHVALEKAKLKFSQG